MFINIAGEWLNKLWYIHRKKYHSLIKRNELLIHSTTCVYIKTLYWMKETRYKGYKKNPNSRILDDILEL